MFFSIYKINLCFNGLNGGCCTTNEILKHFPIHIWHRFESLHMQYANHPTHTYIYTVRNVCNTMYTIVIYVVLNKSSNKTLGPSSIVLCLIAAKHENYWVLYGHLFGLRFCKLNLKYCYMIIC